MYWRRAAPAFTKNAACRSVFRNDRKFVELNVADERAPSVLGAALGVGIEWWGRQNPSTSNVQGIVPEFKTFDLPPLSPLPAAENKPA